MTTFTINNIEYTMNDANGYCYKTENGKKTRIKRAEFDEAFEQYIDMKADEAAVEDAKADLEYEARIAKQEADKKATEEAFNGKKTEKKAKKSKKSKKNIAITIKVDDREIGLTEKQKIFFEYLPNDDSFENGGESTLWTDVYCDTLAGVMNAMVVGAIISTLREKDLIYVLQGKVNGKKCKFFGFTETGKAVLKAMGIA